jgi:hypothetical protein
MRLRLYTCRLHLQTGPLLQSPGHRAQTRLTQALHLETTWGTELAQTRATFSSSDSQVQPFSPSAHYSHGTLQLARLASRAAFSFLLHNFFNQASLRLLLFRQNSSSASYRIAGFFSNIDLRESLKDIHISTVSGVDRGGSLVVYPSRKDFTTTRCVL